MSTKNEDVFAMPENLDAAGQRAHSAIVAQLQKVGHTETGGCKTFYSPEEWRERGEEYGTSSKLIVVYDGGEVALSFSMDAAYNELARPGTKNCYRFYEAMSKALEEAGFYVEECTGWYAAVYESKKK